MSNESSQQPKRSYFELVVLGVVVMLGVAVMGGLLAWMNRPPTYTSTARFLLSQRRDVAANLVQPNLDPMVHVDKFRSEPFLTKSFRPNQQDRRTSRTCAAGYRSPISREPMWFRSSIQERLRTSR